MTSGVNCVECGRIRTIFWQLSELSRCPRPRPLLPIPRLPLGRSGPKKSFQDLILTLQQFWASAGLRDPAALRHGSGRGHVPSGDDAARARTEDVERRLCAAVATAERRALRREPEPDAALLSVPGDHEAVTARYPRSLSQVAWTPSASTPSSTTSASSKTTGRARRWARGAWAGKCGATAWR